ncbi:hypothetical protein J6590_045587 [Homalodisca vitripennis]|nr:hypothetical protein J6590_045587 [Homalodisca vitripennis]
MDQTIIKPLTLSVINVSLCCQEVRLCLRNCYEICVRARSAAYDLLSSFKNCGGRKLEVRIVTCISAWRQAKC